MPDARPEAELVASVDITALLLISLPWLNPHAVGPWPSVLPWLLSVACFSAWLLVPSPSGIGAPSSAWLAAAAISTGIGLVQYVGLSDTLAPWINTTQAGEAFANLRQRNQFATLTTLGLATLLWFCSVRPGARVAVVLPTAAWLAIGTAISSSRTGLMQLLLLVLLTLVWRDICKPLVRQALLATALAYAITPLVLPYLANLDPSTTGIFSRLRAGDALCSSRLTLWSNVLHLIAQKPWLGWGWGELDYAHFITLYPGARFCDILDNAHNLPLQLAVELGVPVAVAVCGVLLWLVARLRPWCETLPQRKLAWAVLALIGLHSMLEYPLWYGPFQIAVALCVWILWTTRTGAAGAAPMPALPSRYRPLVLSGCALVLVAVAYAAWDYHRISQIYLAPEKRSPTYRENTLEKLHASWLFRNQVLFAELTTTTPTPGNAAHVYDLATRLLHFSPEPRVVRPLIESAVMLGREDEARFYLERYRAAFPQDHAAWVRPSSTPNAHFSALADVEAFVINDLKAFPEIFCSGNVFGFQCWQFLSPLLHSLHVHQAHPVRRPHLRPAGRVLSR